MPRPRARAYALVTAAALTLGSCQDPASRPSAAQIEHLANLALTPPPPTRFEDRAAGFAIRGPGVPVVTRAEIETRYRFAASGDGAYEVTWVALQLPVDGWAPLVAQTRDGLLEALGGRLVLASDAAAAGHPRADLIIERPDGRWSHDRLVTGGFGLVIASATYPSGAPEPRRRALAFLDTLSLLSPEDGPPADPGASPATAGPDGADPVAARPGRVVDFVLGLAYTPAGPVALIDTVDASAAMVRCGKIVLDVVRYIANANDRVDSGGICAVHIGELAGRLGAAPVEEVEATLAGWPARRATWRAAGEAGASGERVERLWCVLRPAAQALTVHAVGPGAEDAALLAAVAALEPAEGPGAKGAVAVGRPPRPVGLSPGSARYVWPAPGPGVVFTGPEGARFDFDPDAGFVRDSGLWSAWLGGDDWEVALLAVEVPEALAERVTASFTERFAAGFTAAGPAVQRTTGPDGAVLLSGAAGEGASARPRMMAKLVWLPSGWLVVRHRSFQDAEGEALSEAVAQSVRAVE